MRAMVFHGTANQMGPGPADSEMRPSIFGLTNHTEGGHTSPYSSLPRSGCGKS